MELETTNLIAAVEKERTRHQLSQGAFSKLLGISESYYSMLKSGSRKPNLNILTLLMQKLPEITPEVTYYIMRQGNDGGGGENQGKKTLDGQNPTAFQKTSKKEGGKNTLTYLGHGKPIIPPIKPSKNAIGG